MAVRRRKVNRKESYSGSKTARTVIDEYYSENIEGTGWTVVLLTELETLP